ncbi:MAG TPA: nuclear transport factor 2 family protein [Acidimicrobiales bacterium]|nr:nuclear transport factor 2 family protein [Acidimicrobiales bacterium]
MGLTVDDQLAIQQLAARYNHAIDSGDSAAFAGSFVEDGVLHAGELLVQGRVALEQFGQSFHTSVRAPRHVATNLVIDGHGDQATLRAYVQMYALLGDPPRQQITASGTYDDTLSKVEGNWRFVRRTFTTDD